MRAGNDRSSSPGVNRTGAGRPMKCTFSAPEVRPATDPSTSAWRRPAISPPASVVGHLDRAPTRGYMLLETARSTRIGGTGCFAISAPDFDGGAPSTLDI